MYQLLLPTSGAFHDVRSGPHQSYPGYEADHSRASFQVPPNLVLDSHFRGCENALEWTWLLKYHDYNSFMSRTRDPARSFKIDLPNGGSQDLPPLAAAFLIIFDHRKGYSSRLY